VSEENTQSSSKRVSLRNLYLDPNNFRLIHETEQVNVSDSRVKEKDVANRTYQLLLGDKNQNIQDLVDSFKSNGYLPVDQIQVRELESGGYIVIEGNRRIAALKFLQNEYDQKSIDLGNLNFSIFSNVPIVLYKDADEVHHLTLMALKHISGNRKWGEWNQAKLLETLVSKHKLSEDDVCKQVGISKTELRRSIRALALANQYIDSDYGDQFSASMFPIFREAARNTVLKQWIKWNESTERANHPENCELFFSWLSREPVEDDTDSDYSGNDGHYLEPAISRRDDIRTLSKILNDTRALDKLKQYRNLNEAYRSSDLIFQEKINNAIDSVTSDIATLSQLAISPEQVPTLEESLGKLRTIVEKARNNHFPGVEQTAVYFDRIDQHFTSIKINNYRALQQLEVNELSRINLFAGLNNSGKTSLLEAIYLLCKQNDFNGLAEVTRRRGKVAEGNVPFKWLADQLPDNIEISGCFDNQLSRLSIKQIIDSDRSLDRSRYLKSIEISTEYGSQKLESLTRIYQGKDIETQSDNIKLLCKVVYSSPFFLNEPHHYTSFYLKAVQSKLLPRVFGFIQEKIIPSIKDIRLVDEYQRFLVDDSHFESSMDLTSYGEGLQRIFLMSLLFASSENGVVLIDEFENAIHADLIEKFTPFIHSLAAEFNVQVFLTSHSKECIDSFINRVPSNYVSDFSFHAFIRSKRNEISIREFSGDSFAKLIQAGDVDLRKAK
jgi:hypothetical protein